LSRQATPATAAVDRVGELALDRRQRRLGQRAAGGDQADARVHVVLGLRQQVGGDHRRIAGLVGDDENLARPGELVDADGAEHLSLGLVDIGVAGPDDLVHRRDALRAIGHRRDRLRPADAEDAVGAGEVAAGDHRGMRVGGRQAITSSQPATLAGTIVITGADRSG
jgi:hypothetical protein